MCDLWRKKYFVRFSMRVASEVSEVLFPGKCIRCGLCFRRPGYEERFRKPSMEEVGDYGFGRRMAPFFCPSCRGGFQKADEPFCTVCGTVFESGYGPSHVCGECEKRRPSYNKARACGIYEGPLLWAIRKLKYHAEVGLAVPLGKILQETWRRWWTQNAIDMIVPVPLHPRKMRQRGFNQSYLLVKDWGKWAAAAKEGQERSPSIDLKALSRARHTKPQATLRREDRKKNLVGAFTVADPGRVRQRNILLVDDVMTSGATVDICAKTLLEAGAERVDVLTLARAL